MSDSFLISLNALIDAFILKKSVQSTIQTIANIKRRLFTFVLHCRGACRQEYINIDCALAWQENNRQPYLAKAFVSPTNKAKWFYAAKLNQIAWPASAAFVNGMTWMRFACPECFLQGIG